MKVWNASGRALAPFGGDANCYACPLNNARPGKEMTAQDCMQRRLLGRGLLDGRESAASRAGRDS